MFKRAYKTILAISLLGMFTISMSACSQKAGTSQGNADKSISVLVEGGSPAYKVAQDTAAEFKAKTGYEVKIDAVPYSGVYDKLSAETRAKTATHDVATIDILWFPALADGLSPLDKMVTDDMKSDLLPNLIEGGTYKNNLYGLPTWTNCKVLLYRKDLFENSDNKKKFKKAYGYELAVPKTWKQYEDAAKFFTQDTNNDGKIDIYGTSVFGANNGDSVCSLLDHSAQAGANGLVIDNSGNVNVNGKPFVDALKFLSILYRVDKVTPPETLSMASAETTDLFNNGKLAMMLAWGHFYVSCSEKNPGKVGVAPMIGGEAGVGVVPGPWYQVINKASSKQDIAQQYLKFLYDKNDLYMQALGVAARKSVFEKYGSMPGYEHLSAISASLGAKQTQNRPATKAWAQIESEVLVPVVQNVLSGKDAQAECDAAKTKIEEILKNSK